MVKKTIEELMNVKGIGEKSFRAKVSATPHASTRRETLSEIPVDNGAQQA